MMKTIIRGIREAWLILGVTVLVVLLVNEALKAWIPENGNLVRVKPGAVAPPRRAAAAYEQADWADQYYREHRQARGMRWQPYVYWRRLAFTGATINIDAVGHRQTPTSETAQHAKQILVFGGSTIWGTGVRDQHTIPSELAALLNLGGSAATVTNLGESGYVSSQGLISLLRELHAGKLPDLVIFYDGVNDVFSALQSGQAGIPQNEIERQRDFRVTSGLDNYLAGFPDTLEGVARLAERWSQGAALPDIKKLAKELVDVYLINVKAIQALGQAFGFETVFFWQPSVFSKANPAPGEQAIIDASFAAHRDLQLAADAELRRRSSTDPQVTNLSGAFGQLEEAVYLDFCHLSERGNRHIASIIVDHLGLLTDR